MGGGPNQTKHPQRPQQLSETTSSTCLDQTTRMSILAPQAWESSAPPPQRAISCHTYIGQKIDHANTPFSSRFTSTSIYTQKPAARTPVQVMGTFGEALVLFFSSAPVPFLHTSVGAGCDGFVQLQVQRCRAELQATVAGLTHPAGLKQLLVWHRDLLVTAAGAEHVAAVPAGGCRRVKAALTQTLQPPRGFFTPFRCSKTSTGVLFFKHERLHLHTTA